MKWIGQRDHCSTGNLRRGSINASTESSCQSVWQHVWTREIDQARRPPVLLVHGTADRTVPFAHSESISIAARKANVDSVLLRIENGGHPPS